MVKKFVKNGAHYVANVCFTRVFGIGTWTPLKEQPPQNTAAATELELVFSNLTAPCQIQTLAARTTVRA